MFKEFKEFAFKGNVLDLAVGVIIGGAFGKIVTSLVNDMLMPVIGVLIGGINFADLKFVLTPKTAEVAEVAICYGSFIQSVVDFLIIALSIFMFIKLISLSKKKEEKETTVEAKVVSSPEVILLEEIRDLLKKNNSK